MNEGMKRCRKVKVKERMMIKGRKKEDIKKQQEENNKWKGEGGKEGGFDTRNIYNVILQPIYNQY